MLKCLLTLWAVTDALASRNDAIEDFVKLCAADFLHFALLVTLKVRLVLHNANQRATVFLTFLFPFVFNALYSVDGHIPVILQAS